MLTSKIKKFKTLVKSQNNLTITHVCKRTKKGGYEYKDIFFLHL